MIVRVTKTAACHRGLVCGEAETTQHILLAVNGLSWFSKHHSRNPLQLTFSGGETPNPPDSSLTHIYVPITLQAIICNCVCKHITHCSAVFNSAAALDKATN